MKYKAKIIILAIIIILWMAFIFSMSAKNATQSSDISGGFTYNVLNTFFADFRGLDKSIQDNIVEGLQFVVRKGAHFSAYAVLGGLCFVECSYFKGVNFKNRFITAFLVSVLYAISDEIHQAFIPGRASSIIDVVIDTLGVICGITIIIIIISIYKAIFGKTNAKLNRRGERKKW